MWKGKYNVFCEILLVVKSTRAIFCHFANNGILVILPGSQTTASNAIISSMKLYEFRKKIDYVLNESLLVPENGLAPIRRQAIS